MVYAKVIIQWKAQATVLNSPKNIFSIDPENYKLVYKK
jgi:hypothetical protein